jgi:hypothetical protein
MSLEPDAAIAAFLEAFPPAADNIPAAADVLAAYAQRLPPVILDLWRRGGFGLYGDGEIQILDPRDYEQNLWGWLLREEDDPSRTPIAMSAFGVLFYHRALNDEGAEDIAYLDPHTSEGDVLVYSSNEFFGATVVDPEARDILLQRALFRSAVERHGPLARGALFGYVPALRLGGVQSVERTAPMDARVHLELLLQLALDG